MKRITILIISCSMFLSSPALAETYTDESIHEMFKSKSDSKSHNVMLAQRGRLQMILDGFILGDAELIEKKAAELEEDMQKVIKKFPPPESDDRTEVWSAMYEVIEHSQQMRKELSSKNYRKAYNNYTHIAASCIQCHQVARSWGALEEPKTERENQVAVPPPSSDGMARYVEMKPPVEKTKEAPQPTVAHEEESKKPKDSNEKESDWPTLSH